MVIFPLMSGISKPGSIKIERSLKKYPRGLILRFFSSPWRWGFKQMGFFITQHILQSRIFWFQRRGHLEIIRFGMRGPAWRIEEALKGSRSPSQGFRASGPQGLRAPGVQAPQSAWAHPVPLGPGVPRATKKPKTLHCSKPNVAVQEKNVAVQENAKC